MLLGIQTPMLRILINKYSYIENVVHFGVHVWFKMQSNTTLCLHL